MVLFTIEEPSSHCDVCSWHGMRFCLSSAFIPEKGSFYPARRFSSLSTGFSLRGPRFCVPFFFKGDDRQLCVLSYVCLDVRLPIPISLFLKHTRADTTVNRSEQHTTNQPVPQRSGRDDTSATGYGCTPLLFLRAYWSRRSG